mmetsp:Transcript_89953/g.290618  ORF Transcript_89953/g.290618 Transcript_89953/m.290618 type:complete len:261 (-) Transcript_89953:1117-1899(-)
MPSLNFSNSPREPFTALRISEALDKLRDSSCKSLSVAFRSFSNFSKLRFKPVAAKPQSAASELSPQSLTSSSKPCLKTSMRVFCSLSSSNCCLEVRCILSHCRGNSPVSTVGAFSNLGKCSTKSIKARIESSKSFFSCNNLSLRARSSSTTWAAIRRSSLSFSILRSCSSLSLALSSQLLLIMPCMSFNCCSNFCFSASFSASVKPAAPPTPLPEDSSFFFNSSTSAFSREICEASSFFVAETLIAFARFAYLKVDIVSS